MTAQESGIALDDDEAALVIAEATAAARVVPEDSRGSLDAIAASAQTGAIPSELSESLGELLTASIQGGRARQLYRAEGEKVLNRVLARTPVGAAQRAHVAELNKALTSLAGRTITSARVATRAPGNHTLTIETDGVTLTLGVSAAGVTIESVAT